MFDLRSATWRGLRVDQLPTGQAVYLLHFTRGHPNGRHPRHYIGYSPSLRRRINGHRDGSSYAKYPRAMLAAGIRFRVARVWVGAAVTLEKRLKAYKKVRDYCPICRPALRQENPPRLRLVA